MDADNQNRIHIFLLLEALCDGEKITWYDLNLIGIVHFHSNRTRLFFSVTKHADIQMNFLYLQKQTLSINQ